MASFVLRSREKDKPKPSQDENVSSVGNSLAEEPPNPVSDPMDVDSTPVASQPIAIAVPHQNIGNVLSSPGNVEERAPTAEELRRARLARFGLAASPISVAASPPTPSTPTQSPFLGVPGAPVAVRTLPNAETDPMDVDRDSEIPDTQLAGTSPLVAGYGQQTPVQSFGNRLAAASAPVHFGSSPTSAAASRA